MTAAGWLASFADHLSIGATTATAAERGRGCADEQRDGRWLGDERAEAAAAAGGVGGEALVEVAGEECEIRQVDLVVVIEVAVQPGRAAGLVEVLGQEREVGEIDLTVEVRVAVERRRDGELRRAGVVGPAQALAAGGGGAADLAGGEAA